MTDTKEKIDTHPHQPELAPIVIQLLKGILFRHQHPLLWNDLLSLEAKVIDYIDVMGLTLDKNDNEGYAWLMQQQPKEDEKKSLPRLIARRPLSYPISLLCVLLRKKISESDSSGELTRVIIAREDLVNLMQVYMPDKSNEAQMAASINATINKVIDLGFLRKLKNDNDSVEIQRIIIALIDANWIADFNEKLKSYQTYAESNA